MPIYEYKAFLKGGASKTGIVDADTPRAAREKLRRENVLVRELRELRGGKRLKLGKKGKVLGRGAKPARSASLGDRIRKLRAKQTGARGRDLELVAAITRQLGTLLNSGIPLAEALTAIVDQAESRRIETMFREIRERITQGTSLGDALAMHPAYFSELYVNMIKAGEATGRVDVVMLRLADFMQRQLGLQRKIVSALLYPALMIGLGIIVVSILMAFVVPKITAMLEDMDKELPLPTQILVAASDIFQQYWIVGALAFAAIVWAIEQIYQKSDKGRLFIDRSLLRMWIFGELFRKQAVARFTRTLATLLESGVPAVQSLEITANVVGNRVIADATRKMRARILEGTDIATPLKASGVFPPAVGYMVAVGEKSGELEQMLDRIADAYDEEIEVTTERVTTVIEPIMIVFLAVVVGYIVFAVIMPILQIGAVG